MTHRPVPTAATWTHLIHYCAAAYVALVLAVAIGAALTRWS